MSNLSGCSRGRLQVFSQDFRLCHTVAQLFHMASWMKSTSPWLVPAKEEAHPGPDAYHLLKEGEELLFYHRSCFDPYLISTILQDNEILVTNSRVVITKSEISKINFKCMGSPYAAYDNWQQYSLDRAVVGGYDARMVSPKLWQLLIAVVLLSWCFIVLFDMSPYVIDITIETADLLPIEHVFALIGGACRQLGGSCKQGLQHGLKKHAEDLKENPLPLKWLSPSRTVRTSLLDVDMSANQGKNRKNGAKSWGRAALSLDANTTCVDFHPWKDLDGNGCDMVVVGKHFSFLLLVV